MKMKNMMFDLQLFADASTQLQNTTGSSGLTAEMKTYYEKRLLDQAEPALVHNQFGDPYPIPANGGARPLNFENTTACLRPPRP